MPREGKFEACIPGNHGKREFPLTPGLETIFMAKVGPNAVNFAIAEVIGPP